jgi:hypothetical protein
MESVKSCLFVSRRLVSIRHLERCRSLPSNTKTASRGDVNNLGGSVGALVQSPSDAGAEEISTGDLETVRLYAARVSDVAKRLHG